MFMLSKLLKRMYSPKQRRLCATLPDAACWSPVCGRAGQCVRTVSVLPRTSMPQNGSPGNAKPRDLAASIGQRCSTRKRPLRDERTFSGLALSNICS